VDLSTAMPAIDEPEEQALWMIRFS
jgi:hypothetical protein